MVIWLPNGSVTGRATNMVQKLPMMLAKRERIVFTTALGMTGETNG